VGTILIVDADHTVRSVVRSLLSAFGHTVLEARDGTGAMRCFDQHCGEIDTLIVPLILPEITGPELARYVQTRYPAAGVILMYDSDQRPCLLQNGWRAIRKPFTARSMIDSVRCRC
jgi:CheY-like chemotaxis protein